MDKKTYTTNILHTKKRQIQKNAPKSGNKKTGFEGFFGDYNY